MKVDKHKSETLILPPGKGRVYNCGAMTAIFKADEDETHEKYSVSEWWLEPHSEGSGAHQHEDNDEIFFVLEGTITFLIDTEWVDAEKGHLSESPPIPFMILKIERIKKQVC